MSHSEAPISITIKTTAGSLVTVRAEHGDELDQIVANGLAAITSAVQELEAGIRGSSATLTENLAAQLGAQVIHTNDFNVAPIAAQQFHSIPSISVGGGRNCPHGRMTPIQGTGKDGMLYKGYFCPAPKGAFDKCKNQYIKSTDPNWNTFIPEQIK